MCMRFDMYLAHSLFKETRTTGRENRVAIAVGTAWTFEREEELSFIILGKFTFYLPIYTESALCVWHAAPV
jgi:hypothetical protein